ncbi:MAG TPA: hypothetical protein VGP99_09645 [Tepidisphaeraceae bacterium]|nr:hypothetical protein [Tepidisphaeraceae bacterium]
MFLAIMLILPGILVALALLTPRSGESRMFFLRMAVIVFVVTAVDAAFVEWFIRRERRRLRQWAVADVAMWDGQCFGLLDENGQPLSSSPPLSPEALAKGRPRTVLYDPRNCTLVMDVQRPLQLAVIDV